MFARVTVIQGPPERYDDAVRIINETAVPGAKQLLGLVAAYWAVDQESGEGVTFSIFDSRESLEATEEQVKQLREGAVHEFGGTVVSVKSYEIVGQV